MCSRLSDFAFLSESSFIIIFSTSSLFLQKSTLVKPGQPGLKITRNCSGMTRNLLLPDPHDSDSSPHHLSMIYPFSFHLMTCHLSISLPRGQDDYIIEIFQIWIPLIFSSLGASLLTYLHFFNLSGIGAI